MGNHLVITEATAVINMAQKRSTERAQRSDGRKNSRMKLKRCTHSSDAGWFKGSAITPDVQLRLDDEHHMPIWGFASKVRMFITACGDFKTPSFVVFHPPY